MYPQKRNNDISDNMRRILNYLLGEELVSEQNDKAICDAMCGVAVLWLAAIVSILFMGVVE
jgi:hypothetical protein